MLSPSQAATAKSHLKKYLKGDAHFKSIYQTVKHDFTSSNLSAHNWEHIYRDILNAIVIGEKEKANMAVVLPAIVMHDIGFLFGGTGRTHAEVGATKVGEYIQKNNVSYSSEELKEIVECIRTHKGSMHYEKPQSLEAQVVADADLLDKFGPIGVYQCIRSMTEFNRGAEIVYGKGTEMERLHLITKTGKKIAESGRKYVIAFMSDLKKAYKPYTE